MNILFVNLAYIYEIYKLKHGILYLLGGNIA